MPNRRELVSALGFGAATLAMRPAWALEASPENASPAPWWLLAPLGRGSILKHGWVINDLGPIQSGASVLSLSGNRSLRIHICLHDGNPKGFAHSDMFDLIVMDHGKGVRSVPEDLAPTLLLLADRIRDNESMEVDDNQLGGISRLMTHSERVRAFGARQIN